MYFDYKAIEVMIKKLVASPDVYEVLISEAGGGKSLDQRDSLTLINYKPTSPFIDFD